MNRFWERHIKPVVETLAPERILEIGAEAGWNTSKLLNYCRQNGAKLDVVDPAPQPELFEVLTKFPEEHRFHAQKSLDAIPRLQPAELVLIDGDHNWFTVYNELQLLYMHAIAVGKAPPVVLLHDVAWPYARRDMYYDPDRLNPSHRHPYARRGMLPGQSELSDAGVNGHFANALHEGGSQNGVLTALEDFQASCGIETSLHLLPFFNGLGILVPSARMTPALQAVIVGFFSTESLLETCTALEETGMLVRAELASLKTVLSNRNAALARAREQLGAQSVGKLGFRRLIPHANNLARRLRSRFESPR